MKCPFENIECAYLETSGMTKPVECSKCEHYNKGIRKTGATPVLAWIVDKIQRKPKGYKQVCSNCGKSFTGTAKINLCPSCYV